MGPNPADWCPVGEEIQTRTMHRLTGDHVGTQGEAATCKPRTEDSVETRPADTLTWEK